MTCRLPSTLVLTKYLKNANVNAYTNKTKSTMQLLPILLTISALVALSAGIPQIFKLIKTKPDTNDVLVASKETAR